jgi:hypothetical protein
MLRFTLRDLIWLMVVCCVVAASYYYHQKQVEAVLSLERDINDLSHRLWVVKEHRDWFWRQGKYYNPKTWEEEWMVQLPEYDPRDKAPNK